MHFTTLLAVVAVAIGVQAGVVSDAATECGSLGVFSPESLPEGVDPRAVRKCLEHPLSNGTSSALEKRDCYFGKDYGCTDGYCWKECGTQSSGQWCWTAWEQGFGSWRTCGVDADCGFVATSDCGQGGCDKCGCSC